MGTFEQGIDLWKVKADMGVRRGGLKGGSGLDEWGRESEDANEW